MPVIERYPGAPVEIWHNGQLVAIVYETKILVNSSEDVDVIFDDPEDNKAWMS